MDDMVLVLDNIAIDNHLQTIQTWHPRSYIRSIHVPSKASGKGQAHLATGTHIASHGYAKRAEDLTFVQATHVGEKPDSDLKRNRKPV